MFFCFPCYLDHGWIQFNDDLENKCFNDGQNGNNLLFCIPIFISASRGVSGGAALMTPARVTASWECGNKKPQNNKKQCTAVNKQ